MDTIMKCKFGSELYGTNTKDSDTDIKGVFLPTIEQIFLGRIPKTIQENTKTTNETKNTKEDIDIELFSLHYFIKLACEGQTVALDMLHCPNNMLIETSTIWGRIVENREKFYTKNLKAFVGYARTQAARYGIRGSRLNDAKRVVDFLDKIRQVEIAHCDRLNSFYYKLSDVWKDLPEGEHIFKHEDKTPKIYEVCGKKIQETVKIEYALNIVDRFYKQYGERAKQAANNEGIDWKAVSHAVRAAMQVKELLTENTITFPLKEAELVKEIKQGRLDYITKVAPVLEGLMEEVEILSKNSALPEKADRKFWDNFIFSVYLEIVSDFVKKVLK